MIKKRYLYLLIAALSAIAFSSVFTIKSNANKTEPENHVNVKKRADIITINTLQSFGPLERKAVPFFHDAHTNALEKINKNCEECHLIKEPSY